ncbi:SH3 domain-containing protein [Streptomyces sp. NPDC056411]|uniref:SH3 domain-containing protein n=1 Tax=Streptomyces sp. NPDC056411 TaxID=3345813 RepID=UPI0035D6EC57
MRTSPKRSLLAGAAATGVLVACGGVAIATPSGAATDPAAPSRNLSVASVHGAGVYAKPSSSAHKLRTYPYGTRLRIECRTDKTPSGHLWYRLHTTMPTAWVPSGNVASPAHPPKDCS